MQAEHIAISFLADERELTLLSQAFDCAWPVEMAPRFNMLLHAIDEADRAVGVQHSTNQSQSR